jgi:thiol-disulfide isomerase/thioredoxin
MNNNTKVMSGITAVLMCAVLFAGCSGKTENKPSAVQAETLSSVSTSVETTASETVNQGYKVIVKDEKGNPVKDVTVQFCSDEQCVLGNTNVDGVAFFDFPESSYTIHMLAVPDGFEEDDDEYTAEKGITEITLKGSSKEKSDEDEYTWSIPACGFEVYMAPEYRPENLKGVLSFDARKMTDDPYICYFQMDYYAVTDDDLELFNEYSDEWMEAILNGEEVPEAPRKGWDDWTRTITSNIFMIFNIDSSRTEDELLDAIKENMDIDEFKSFEKICTKDNTDFYLAQTTEMDKNAELHKENMGDLYDEFAGFCSDKETFLSCFTFSKPDNVQTIKAGDVISFETTDIDGNTISSKDLFSENKVTMINVWATYCGPCRKELPELAEMSKEFEAKGCGMIGLVTDGKKKEGNAEKAKDILSENGCEYTNILPSDDMAFLNKMTSIPCTIFVDSNGVVLTDPIVGNQVDKYPVTVDECLASME